MNLKQVVVLILLIVVFVAWFVFDLGQYTSLDYFNASKQALFDGYAKNPIEYATAYFVIYVIAAAFALPVAAILTLVGGAIFGLSVGFLLVSFASTLGATLAFLLARTLLQDWVQSRYQNKLKIINDGINKDGLFYLFTLRMIPVLPFFAINLLSGLTSMRILAFALVSQVGMAAGTVVYVFAGTQLATIDQPGDLLSGNLLAAFAALGLLPLVTRKFIQIINKKRALKGFRRPKKFDDNLIVIGAGSAGLVAALTASIARAKVSLVEKGAMGGDCLNTGCVPSKTLIQSAKVAHKMRHAEKFGIKTPEVEVDFAAVMERVQDAIKEIQPKDSVERYTALGVNCINGAAELVDPWTVKVNDQNYTARSIVLATGGHPFIPPIPGIDKAKPLNSDTIWEIRKQPKHFLIVGGGPIGCELAQCFARLGSEVTILQSQNRLLPKEDPEVSTIIKERFESEGINVLTDHLAQKFPNGTTLEAKQGDKVVKIKFDRVLVATGRKANLQNLGLDKLNLATTPQGTIAINDHMQTSMEHIYACGDLSGPYQFTHMASYQAGFAALNALFGDLYKFRANYRVVPWTTYTDPEVARVGYNETEAIAEGIKHQVTMYDMDDSDRAIADGDTTGFVKVITQGDTDKILGVTIVSPQAGELLPEFVLAMTHGLGLKKIMDAIHAYPTMSEANKLAASSWRKANAPEAILSKLHKFHAWRR